jgi:membrane protein implicated in regulation of membrane protease activity
MELATIIFMAVGILLIAFAAVAFLSTLIGARNVEGRGLQEKLHTLNYESCHVPDVYWKPSAE